MDCAKPGGRNRAARLGLAMRGAALVIETGFDIARSAHTRAAAQPIDSDELELVLQRASERGYAVVDNAWFDGLTQIGATIAKDGTAIGGVGVAIPSHRVQPDLIDGLGGQLRAAAMAIADRLGDLRSVVSELAPGVAR